MIEFLTTLYSNRFTLFAKTIRWIKMKKVDELLFSSQFLSILADAKYEWIDSEFLDVIIAADEIHKEIPRYLCAIQQFFKDVAETDEEVS